MSAERKLADVRQLIWALRFYADGNADKGVTAMKALDRLTYYGFCACGKIVHRNLRGELHAHKTPGVTGASGRKVTYWKCAGKQPLTFDAPPPEPTPEPEEPADPRPDGEIRFSLLELE